MIQPKPIHRTAYPPPFVLIQQPPVLIVRLPLLERVDGLPLPRYLSDAYNLPQERSGHRRVAVDVHRLAFILRHKLDYIISGTELEVGNGGEDVDFVGCVEDAVEAATG